MLKIKNNMYLLKALLISFITTLGFLLVISLLLRFTSLQELKLPLLNNITVIISIVLGSLYISLKVKENGWINGALVGFLYYVFVILINMVYINEISFDLILFAKIIAASLTGAIGGIIGINLN